MPSAPANVRREIVNNGNTKRPVFAATDTPKEPGTWTARRDSEMQGDRGACLRHDSWRAGEVRCMERIPRRVDHGAAKGVYPVRRDKLPD